MLHWLQNQLITDETANWMDDCARWAIGQFGEQFFWRNIQLVLPDATYFPEKVDGPEAMAQYILRRVSELMGVARWPWQLCDMRTTKPQQPQRLGIQIDRHFGSTNPIPVTQTSDVTLQVPFVIDQVGKPQDLIAATANTCAQHILWQSQQTPPGGAEFFEQTAEMLAVFSGFGIMQTNSAYTYRGSCASCYNPRANRQAHLSESETLYALALFCHIRKEPTREVLKNIKPHLKSSFKLALKQIRSRPPLFETRQASVVTS